MRAGLPLAAVLLTVVACQSPPAPAEATGDASGVVTWAASADRMADGVADRSTSRTVTLRPGASVTLKDFAR